MYYILNETNQIIAADSELLDLCGFGHIDELALGIARGEAKFSIVSKEKLTILTESLDENYHIKTSALSSLIGHLTLVFLDAKEAKSDETLIENQQHTILLDLDSEPLPVSSEIDEDMLFRALFEDAKDVEVTETPLLVDEEEEVFNLDLLLQEEPEPKQEDFLKVEYEEQEVDLPKTESETFDEIYIDIESLSREIGVSAEDYQAFLNEYIDTALELKDDLQSSDETVHTNGLATLAYLSDNLHLEQISDIITTINFSTLPMRPQLIQRLYDGLSCIVTSHKDNIPKASKQQGLATQEPTIEFGEALQFIKEEAKVEIVDANGFGTISLEGIKPIYFDFMLAEAADELSLPVDLIEEFVKDFIVQAHIETKNMLAAYKKGDLITIQKIGHLLKGASSNLRITALSDTLFKIQFCEESSLLEFYIKDYWAHFLSFENQINALTK